MYPKGPKGRSVEEGHQNYKVGQKKKKKEKEITTMQLHTHPRT